MRLIPCVGCGALSERHPVVAVVSPLNVPEGVEMSVAGPHGFVAVACCAKCHAHPEQRPRPIKGHFFMAQDAAAALFHAGSNASGIGG